MAPLYRRSARLFLSVIAAIVLLGVAPVTSADTNPGLTGHLTAVAGGLLVVALVIVGIAVTIVGLRDDLRKRRRGYRRRSRRVRASIQPEEKRATPP